MPYRPHEHPSKTFSKSFVVQIPFTRQEVDALQKAIDELRKAGWHAYPMLDEIGHGKAKYTIYYDEIEGRNFVQELYRAWDNYAPLQTKIAAVDHPTFLKIEKLIQESERYSLDVSDPETLTLIITIHGGLVSAHELDADLLDALT